MAEEECILCYDPLDVPVFAQNITDDIIVGETFSRLQCGHAYHTSCLLRALQHRSACPLCNIIAQEQENDGWWQNGRIAIEGRCVEIMEKAKRDKEVRESLRTHKAVTKDLMSLKKDFEKRVKDFKAGLRTEMGLDEKMKALKKSRNAVVRIFGRKAKAEGSLMAGAYSMLPAYRIERFLFGSSRFFLWRIRRIFN